jgi:hypothetical protein
MLRNLVSRRLASGNRWSFRSESSNCARTAVTWFRTRASRSSSCRSSTLVPPPSNGLSFSRVARTRDRSTHDDFAAGKDTGSARREVLRGCSLGTSPTSPCLRDVGCGASLAIDVGEDRGIQSICARGSSSRRVPVEMSERRLIKPSAALAGLTKRLSDREPCSHATAGLPAVRRNASGVYRRRP